MPVFGTIASKFNDDGVTALYHCPAGTIKEKTGVAFESSPAAARTKQSTSKTIIIPPERTRYLAEISETVRTYHRETESQAEAMRRVWHLEETAKNPGRGERKETDRRPADRLKEAKSSNRPRIEVGRSGGKTGQEWEDPKPATTGMNWSTPVRGKEVRVPLYTESLSHQKIPKISLPRFEDPGEIYSWLRRENLPGYFPYTAGVFPHEAHRRGSHPHVRR
jgi:methylmalonyl-CoA mutase